MALKRVLNADDFSKLEDDRKALYVQEGEKYRLDAEPDDGLELKNALASERKKAQTQAQEIAKLREKYGDIDPEEVARLKAEAAKREEDEQKKAGNYDALAKQMAEKHAAEIAARDKVIAEKDAVISGTFREQEATRALIEAGVPGPQVKLLLPHVLSRSKAVVVDGRIAVRVLDEKGTERISPKAGNDGYATLAELVEEMKGDQVFAPAFPGSGASGGGAAQNGNGGAGAGNVRSKADLKTIDDKVKFVDQHGREAFENLPAT